MGPPEPRRIPRIHEILIEFFAEARSYSAGTGISRFARLSIELKNSNSNHFDIPCLLSLSHDAAVSDQPGDDGGEQTTDDQGTSRQIEP